MLGATSRAPRALLFGAAFMLVSLLVQAEVATLRAPDGGVQPQVQVGADGTVHLIYFKGDARAGDVWYVRRAPGATAFSAPLRVNSQAGSAMSVGTIRGARLALGKNDQVHVAWMGSAKAEPKGPAGKTPMLYTALAADGKSFATQRNVMQSSGGLDGGGTVAADGAGNVYVIWHGGGPPETARSVYLAKSTDSGATFAAETAILPTALGACACCGIEARVDAAGTLVVLYRSATEMVHRDAYALLSRDQGRTFTATVLSPWEVKMCPMSTAGIISGKQGPWVTWETNGQVSLAAVTAAGQVASRSDAPGAGAGRKHPALAVNADGAVLLAWTEGTGWERGGKVCWQVYGADGKPAAERGERADLPAWSRPAAFADAAGQFTVVY